MQHPESLPMADQAQSDSSEELCANAVPAKPRTHACAHVPHLESTHAGDALAAYNILRAFSWQIRLSPFAFEELCAALYLPTPSPLMDELHVSPALCILPIFVPSNSIAMHG